MQRKVFTDAHVKGVLVTIGCGLQSSAILGQSNGHAIGLSPQVQTFWVQTDQEILSCPLDRITNRCPIDGKGVGLFDKSTGVAQWFPDTAQRVGGLGVEGVVVQTPLQPLKGPQGNRRTFKMISNGFQSWSLSGMIDIPGAKSLKYLVSHFDERKEEFRDGTDQSWEFGFVLNKDQFGYIGALSAKTWRPWVRYWQQESPVPKDHQNHPESIQNNIEIRFLAISGMTGDDVLVEKNASIQSEPWFFSHGPLDTLPEKLEDYRAAIDNTVKPQFTGKVHFGWNSWYHFWNSVTQQDVEQNLDIVGRILARILVGSRNQGSLIGTIDDGWQQRWGEWLPNSKFPDSLDKMAASIEARGFMPGLWLAPFLVSVTSPMAKNNSHWFVKTADFQHPSGRYKILDTTHPEVIEHLKGVMGSIRDAGFKFVKIDFLFAGTFLGRRFADVTSMQAYEKGMEVIRRTLGPSVEILACGAPHLPSRAYMDRWRIGPDIAYQFPTGQPTWVDIDIQLRNMGARWFLCKGLACDSDPWLIRGRRSVDELKTSLWVASLMGQGFTFSDDFLRVSPARQGLIPDRPALDQASSGTPASPDYGQWLSDVGQRLGSATVVDRLVDRKIFQAPRLWHTAQPGRVLLNFSNRSFQWGQDLVLPRQSLFREPQTLF